MGVLESSEFLANECGSQDIFYAFAGLSILYKLILHAVALVLAFLTKNIKVDVLNDYRYNSTIILVSTVLMVWIIMHYIVQYSKTWFEITWAVIVFLLATIYLGLTFIPKVCHLHKNRRMNFLIKQYDKNKRCLCFR